MRALISLPLLTYLNNQPTKQPTFFQLIFFPRLHAPSLIMAGEREHTSIHKASDIGWVATTSLSLLTKNQ